MPLFLVTTYLVIVMFRTMATKTSTETSAVPAIPDKNDFAKTEQRRKVIEDGRLIVTEFNKQARISSLTQFVDYRSEWPAIRSHLQPDVLSAIENGRLAVSSKGGQKDGKIYYLMDDLSRLEKEWGLV